ncbi:MAG TPA: hypothetical protein VNL17_09240 [Verrucomicrobiae bacterium]|nr:hypothetical protein [Verrucomicrobiae bacterium]
MFEATSNTTFNTSAPTGALINSGWQYEGLWPTNGQWLATPIAPNFFLAAIHVGGSPGDVFQLNGFFYHTVAFTDCPNSDLRVWQVAETFPTYAPLYTGTNEVSQTFVVFGRGTPRGDSVTVGGQLKGWKWGIPDGSERWGQNTVSQTFTDPGLGDFLVAFFDRTGPTNECMLSNGDSSGGLFIKNGSTWELAGVNYASTGYYSLDGTTNANTQFFGAMVDQGGLYTSSGPGFPWTFTTNQVSDIPGYFFVSRVSAHVAWINSVINFTPGPDLRIADIAPAGTNVQISLSTGSNRLYLIQKTSDLVTGTWTTVSSNVPGNGGFVTIVDTNATTQTKRFYRVQLLQ